MECEKIDVPGLSEARFQGHPSREEEGAKNPNTY